MSVYYLSRFGVNVVQVYLFVKNAVFHFLLCYICVGQWWNIGL